MCDRINIFLTESHHLEVSIVFINIIMSRHIASCVN